MNQTAAPSVTPIKAPTPAALRRLVYGLLITIAVAGVVGRILGVGRVIEPWLFRPDGVAAEEDPRGAWPVTRPEPMPTHGDNDRSRWVTIRTLVDQGTYVIGHREPNTLDPKGYTDTGPATEDGWRTIDKVMNPDTRDFYSSKPPLLPTILAGEYWLFKHVAGWSIVENRWQVVPTILLTVNALPFLIYLMLLAKTVEQLGLTDWGRLFVLAAGCFATLLTPFLTTLNNHTIAACTAMFTLYLAIRIWNSVASPACQFALAGFFAGFTACNELPAAAFAAAIGFLLLLKAPRQTLLLFLPALAAPVAGFFLTNYAAIGHWRPAYSEFGGPWYEYEGSHWKPIPGKMNGIDWAGTKESEATYAFHLLLGHHGLFSLTPIFLLTFVGIVLALVRRDGQRWSALKLVAGGTLLLTVVVVGFYIFKVGDRSRNYGGWTTGLRWLMWLTPLWLVSMLPAADWLSTRRLGRGVGYALLAVSVMSISYAAWNPWRHPWLYNFLEARGWIGY